MRMSEVVAPALIVFTVTASAEAAQRTFVSTTGVDTNPCTLTAPCRAFSAALTHTDPGGEVIVLDSGAYGRVTVSQPVTIEAPAGVYAGISVFASTNGIDVNAPGATVVLRGLSISGQGGDIGINVSAVGALRIDRCRISGMGQQGIVATATGASVMITHAYVSDNGHDGIWINGVIDVSVENTMSARNMSGAAFFNGARVTLRDSTFTSSVAYGVYSSGGPVSTPTTVRADGVISSYNAWQGFMVNGVASSLVSLTLTRSSAIGNSRNGLWVSGDNGPATATVSDSTFSNQPPFYGAVVTSGAAAKLVVARSVIVDNAYFGMIGGGGLFESGGGNIVRNNNGGAAQTSGTITTFLPI